MTHKLSIILGILLYTCGIAFAEDLPTQASPSHVTDTIYVIDKPDTVYLPISKKTTFNTGNKATAIGNESVADSTLSAVEYPDTSKISKELPPPKILIRLNSSLAADLILIAFNSLILDFGIVFENTHRGAIVLNPTMYLEFGDMDFMSHEKEWDGFRNTAGIEIGYRQFLGTMTFKQDTAKNISRNTPRNSISLYLQGSLIPTFLFSHDKYLYHDSNYTTHFIPGISVYAGLGIQNNIGVIFDLNFGIGYQQWSRNDKRIPFQKQDFNISLFNGSTSSGMFFKIDFAIEL